MGSLLRGRMPPCQGAGYGAILGGDSPGQSRKGGARWCQSNLPPSSLLPDGHARTGQSLSSLFSPYLREFKGKVKCSSFPCHPGRKILASTSLPTAELGL